MTVAGLMAENATGMSWDSIFSEFVTSVNAIAAVNNYTVSNATKYTKASSQNPWLAGGMDSSVKDYNAFLYALYSRSLLSNQSFQAMIADHTSNVTIIYSPADETANETWHYGLGCWPECPYSDWQSPPCGFYNGSNSTTPYTVSSPGAFGFYPWINLDANYYGIVGTSSLVEFVVRIIIAVVLFIISVAFCSGVCICCCCIRRKKARMSPDGLLAAEISYH